MGQLLRQILVTAAAAVGLFTAFPADAQEAPTELSRLLGVEGTDGFRKALTPRQFDFPADHGPHPEFRNEWWYATGNLDSTEGRRFGFELTIFRFGLTPAAVDSASAWRSHQVYIAHFAITDVAGDAFLTAERYSRAALGLAGATAAPFRVWIDNWEIAADPQAPEQWRLRASDPTFGIDVQLASTKPVVLNGDAGLSQKSADPGNASYYYAMTRLATDGKLFLGDETFDVSGMSWLDREWSSSALGRDQQGWDWFALQLDDGSDLMFYNLRLRDGSQDPMSAGTRVDANGSYRKIERQSLNLQVDDYWDSPAGGRYPARWTLTVPDENLTLEVIPVMADQELFTTVRYWEGAVDVRGSKAGEPISGRGYVELTGYAD